MRENTIVLSIIIPVYNAKKYLRHCVESITNQVQDCKDEIEIILIDDGSTDGSEKICDSLATKHSFVRVIHQTNSGTASARNTGIKNSIGYYIFFIDNDDLLNKKQIPNIIHIIKTKKADVIIHKYDIFTGNTIFEGNANIDTKQINDRRPHEVLDYLRKSRINITAPWIYIFKREIITDNEIEFKVGQSGVDDAYFTPILFINSKTFFFNNNSVLSWRVHGESQSNTHNTKEHDIKIMSVIDSINIQISKVKFDYQKKYLLYCIYRYTYALLKEYYNYERDFQAIMKKWRNDNETLLKLSAQNSGLAHALIFTIFGSLLGSIISYKLASAKSFLLAALYRK